MRQSEGLPSLQCVGRRAQVEARQKSRPDKSFERAEFPSSFGRRRGRDYPSNFETRHTAPHGVCLISWNTIDAAIPPLAGSKLRALRPALFVARTSRASVLLRLGFNQRPRHHPPRPSPNEFPRMGCSPREAPSTASRASPPRPRVAATPWRNASIESSPRTGAADSGGFSRSNRIARRRTVPCAATREVRVDPTPPGSRLGGGRKKATWGGVRGAFRGSTLARGANASIVAGPAAEHARRISVRASIWSCGFPRWEARRKRHRAARFVRGFRGARIFVRQP